MKKTIYILLTASIITIVARAQSKVLTPEQLIELNRVSAVGLSKDGQDVIYRTSTFDLSTNERINNIFSVSVNGGTVTKLSEVGDQVTNKNVSPNGQWKIVSKDVKVKKVTGQDYYGDVPKSDVYIYDQLNYRHWDVWEDGAYSHLFIQSNTDVMLE